MRLLLALGGYVATVLYLFCGLHIGVAAGVAAIAYSLAPKSAGGTKP